MFDKHGLTLNRNVAYIYKTQSRLYTFCVKQFKNIAAGSNNESKIRLL